MKKVTLAITLVTLAVFSFSSCKKDDDDGLTGRSAQIVGSWRETEEGSDVNANGTWDASEKNAVNAADAAKFVFNSNGSGTVTDNQFGSPIPININWMLYNNENNIRIIATIPILNITDTLYYNIVTMTNKEAIVKDTTASPVKYMTLTKQ